MVVALSCEYESHFFNHNIPHITICCLFVVSKDTSSTVDILLIKKRKILLFVYCSKKDNWIVVVTTVTSSTVQKRKIILFVYCSKKGQLDCSIFQIEDPKKMHKMQIKYNGLAVPTQHKLKMPTK